MSEDLSALLALAEADSVVELSVPATAATSSLGTRKRALDQTHAKETEVEAFSRLPISKRVVSAEEVQLALAGRTVLPLRRLADSSAIRAASAAAAAAASGGGGASRGGASAGATDLVTIGVLANRGYPKLGPSGGTFLIWRLSDFGSDVTVFIWGAAYEALKHEYEGGIFLLSCPEVLPARERSAFALKVTTAAQVCKLGTCPTFAICPATRKDGAHCTMAVNTAVSRHCVHHMGAEYSRLLRAVTAGRGEITQQTNSRIVPGFADGRMAADPATAIRAGLLADGRAPRHSGATGPGNAGRIGAGAAAAEGLHSASLHRAMHRNMSTGSYAPDVFARMEASVASSSGLFSAAANGGDAAAAKAAPASGYFRPGAYANDESDGYGYSGRAGAGAAAVRIDGDGSVRAPGAAAAAPPSSRAPAAPRAGVPGARAAGGASDTDKARMLALAQSQRDGSGRLSHGLRQAARIAGADGGSARVRDDAEGFAAFCAEQRAEEGQARTAQAAAEAATVQGSASQAAARRAAVQRAALADPLGALLGGGDGGGTGDGDDDSEDLEIVPAEAAPPAAHSTATAVAQRSPLLASASVFAAAPRSVSGAAAAPRSCASSLPPTARANIPPVPATSAAVELARLSSVPAHSHVFADQQRMARLAATATVAERLRGVGSAATAPPVAPTQRPAAVLSRPAVARPAARPAAAAGAVTASSSSSSAATAAAATRAGGLSAALGILSGGSGSAALVASRNLASEHADEARADAADALLARMDRGEQIEAMGAAMAAVTSRSVTRWFCADCEKWFDKSPAMCVQERHAVTSAKKTQYAFRCEHCSRKAFAFDRLYVAPCPNCSHMRWAPASVFGAVGALADVRSGLAPAMHATELVANSLRGDAAPQRAHELAQTGEVAR